MADTDYYCSAPNKRLCGRSRPTIQRPLLPIAGWRYDIPLAQSSRSSTSRTRPRIESGIASLLRRFEPASHAGVEAMQIARFATEAPIVRPCPIRDTARHDRGYCSLSSAGHLSRAGIRPQPNPGRIA